MNSKQKAVDNVKCYLDKGFYRKSSTFSPMFQFDADEMNSKETFINKNVFTYNNKKIWTRNVVLKTERKINLILVKLGWVKCDVFAHKI